MKPYSRMCLLPASSIVRVVDLSRWVHAVKKELFIKDQVEKLGMLTYPVVPQDAQAHLFHDCINIHLPSSVLYLPEPRHDLR